ncbi:MAG TPA: hypothetical protein VKM55_01990 [Candidatus Lokiarchaeia archaeon]|nr:hypothetical protein [Candidatus Lokiarchaeia archaeon]
MSLDGWIKTQKKPEESKELPKKPEKKPPKKPPIKKEKPQKPAKKAPVKKHEDIDEPEDVEDASSEKSAGKAAKGSALKAIGLNSYVLTCPSCKFKRKLAVKGDVKPYQLICKKCGAEMKVVEH